MCKRCRKLFLILGVLLLSLIITSCFKQERYDFKEGKYIYEGEQVIFYDNIVIEKVQLSFKTTPFNENQNNIIINRKTNVSYYVEFLIISDGIEYSCSFNTLDKVGDQVDVYYIELDVSTLTNKDNSILNLRLHFQNPSFISQKYQENNGYANYIRVEQDHLIIGDDFFDWSLFEFPHELFYKEE
jgi:hypothetical protein